MEQKNLDKAMDIYAKLMMGEEIKRGSGPNQTLYQEYIDNAEVYEILENMTKRLNLHLYEYNEALYLTAGDGNKTFGYSNEELKRTMGLKNNRELYLTYYIIYQVILCFYKDSGSYQFVESVSPSEVLERTTTAFAKTISKLDVLVSDEIEEHSIKSIAILWDEMPISLTEVNDDTGFRASRGSRSGLVKTTLNFLVNEELLVVANEQYYPTDRMKALIENYFEQYRGRLYELLREDKVED
ncbi:MAG: DUF6063 family protein [Lachnospiraceae bacterium]|nr:DUF6063 family protein [Lachnospiraceae bacterium]